MITCLERLSMNTYKISEPLILALRASRRTIMKFEWPNGSKAIKMGIRLTSFFASFYFPMKRVSKDIVKESYNE